MQVEYDFNLYNNYIMDSLFNRCTIPESTALVLIVRPSGKTWVTGMASRFDTERYNDLFFGSTGLSEREFVHIIDQLNDLIYSNWPCMLCQCLGYSLCLCTLSLSFLYPSEDVNRAEKLARQYISEVNDQTLESKGLVLKLFRRRCTSWLEFSKQQSKGGIEM